MAGYNNSTLFYYESHESNEFDNKQDASVIIHKKKIYGQKKRERQKMYQFGATLEETYMIDIRNDSKSITNTTSLPDLNNNYKMLGINKNESNTVRTTSSYTNSINSPYSCRFVVNVVTENWLARSTNPFGDIRPPVKWRIYRCQFDSPDESCCCSCNSDAMFEVMKSLYDCYKKKNCDHCNCILCGHLPKEERKLGEVQKSAAATETTADKKQKEKVKDLSKELEVKSPDEKEKILKDMALKGIPLPEGKTASEKKIIDKVRHDLGMPPTPKTAPEKQNYKDAVTKGIIVPLEGKTPAEKEKILKRLLDNGIPMPEGRTPSEKALIAKVKASLKPPAEAAKVPSEKFKKAKAEGLLTPLKGKTSDRKEKILRGLAKLGIPLPDGDTASEKKLVDKVRKDLGLPPKHPSEKDKYNAAQAQGLITPLDGKNPEQKEKILKKLAKAGIPLPEGRTPSEKALIKKIKDETGVAAPAASPLSPPKVAKIPSEKLRKAKAEGLLTPLAGKTPEEKEKILKGLAKLGIPLPEAKSPSEQKLIDKVRKDLGLPPKHPSIKDKYNVAQAQGLITPLDGKNPEQKEKILKKIAKAGLPLPEGRTPSEKALIKKVKGESPAVAPAAKPEKVSSDKLRKAQVQGLMTPLKGKTPEQREKILKGLAKLGIPLPDGDTPSEKKLISKIRKDLGLPPKHPAQKDKYNAAQAQGLITPLDGKTPAQKEKVLKGLVKAGLPFPEGRTPSEKALIKKMKKEKAETGLVTPTKPGKAPVAKSKKAPSEKLSKEAKTLSEQKLVDKVKKDLEVSPKRPSVKDKFSTAQAQGLIAPSAKLKDVSSEKLRKAKAAGLLTPLEGKSPAEKEKILKGLAAHGIPLPEPRTPSERRLIDKVRKDMGLPPHPSPSIRSKVRKAHLAGIITPLEGKTSKEKEKIINGLIDAGIPLPEGRTASEKALIDRLAADIGTRPPLSPEAKKLDLRTAKLTKEGKGPSDECICPILYPPAQSKKELKAAMKSSIFKKAKAQGLLTPLEGKTPEQKEKILKGLAGLGLPLPEGKSTSDKKLIDKVRKDIGLPPSPKTPSQKLRHEKAYADKKIMPLEGKTPEEKEKILKDLLKAGIPLPEGKTPFEKALIKKIKSEVGTSTPPVISTAKLKAAKASGLLTSLDGKIPEDKEKILRGLAMQGLPFPIAETASDKKLADKVRGDLGMPPEPKTPSDQENYNNALAKGFIIPLEGKTPEEKENILRKLHKEGIELPVGRTKSEKALIAAMKAEPRPVASKKVGGEALAKRSAGVKAEGVTDEFQDVTKSKTCERGCGCDKKKIRFKHSYVKIRVTSPDVSSLCPCPYECLPGVKGGVFVDNDGIKVTVGSAIGFPSLNINTTNILDNHRSSETSLNKLNVSNQLQEHKDYNKYNYKNNFQNHQVAETYEFNNMSDLYDLNEMYANRSNFKSNYLETVSTTSNSSDSLRSSTHNAQFKSTSNTVLVLKNKSSLSCSSNFTNSLGTISVISLHNSDIIPTSSHYLCYPDSLTSSSSDDDGSKLYPKQVNHNICATNSCAHSYMPEFPLSTLQRKNKKIKPIKAYNRDIYNFRMSQQIDYNNPYTEVENNNVNPIVIIYNSNNNSQDIINIVEGILSQHDNNISETSSLFVMVPTSDEEEDETNSELSESSNSIICLRLSENFAWGKNITKNGISLKTRGRRNAVYDLLSNESFTGGIKSLSPNLTTGTEAMYTPSNQSNVYLRMEEKPLTIVRSVTAEFSMDTTQDRPCCCQGLEMHYSDMVSDVFSPMMLSQGYNSVKSYNCEKHQTLGCEPSSIFENASLTTCMSLNHGNKKKVVKKPRKTASPAVRFETKTTGVGSHTVLPQTPPSPQVKASCSTCKCCKDPTPQPTSVTTPPKQVVKTVGCGPTTCEHLMPPGPIDPCVTCTHPVHRDERKISCVCSGKETKIVIPYTCPCEEITPISEESQEPTTPLKKPCKCGEKLYKTTQDPKGKPKKYKNIKCECPPNIFPSPVLSISPPSSCENDKNQNTTPGYNCDPIKCEFENSIPVPLPKYDMKTKRQMQSETTQTTSGFKLKVLKRKVVEAEMSFEDALKFFEEHPEFDCKAEGQTTVTVVEEGCSCEEQLAQKKKATNVHQMTKTEKKGASKDKKGKNDEKDTTDKKGVKDKINKKGAKVETVEKDKIDKNDEKKTKEKVKASRDDNGKKDSLNDSDVESLHDSLVSVEEEDELLGFKVHIEGKGSMSKGLSGICCFGSDEESNTL